MMLSFQNLHQLVFNLSQVTSVVSTTYTRLTSTSAKKKPEIDVLCSESFLSTLRALEQSENARLFKDLQNVKFGPRFEDMQWIFSEHIDFRFTSGKSFSKSDFYILLDSNDVKDFYLCSTIDKLGTSQNSGKRQKKILADLEYQLTERSKWGDLYISKDNFDDNKKSSFCGTDKKPTQFGNSSPFCSRLVRNIHTSSNLQNAFIMQKRGFKTKRETSLKEKEQKSIFPKSRSGFNSQLFNNLLNKEKSLSEKLSEYPVMSEMINTETLTPEEKLKMKVSYAEGYMAALKELKKPESLMSKFFKVCFVLVAITSAVLFFFSDESLLSKKKVFTLRLGKIDPEETDVTFSDVKGVLEVKEELLEIVQFLKDPAKFSSLGGKFPKGVLLVGPPGTGKTLLARAVAGEANVPFFHASGSEFDGIFVGEGARRVQYLFQSAKENAPSIIFIDEIDCVGSKRKSTMFHPYANQTINQLLSEMDGFSRNEGVIVIGATNRKEDLDAALLRPGRFDVEVQVPLPDLNGRKEILELYLSRILYKDIDISRLAKATAGCSGAELEAMVNHAAIRAATEGAPYVTMEYLENAKEKILIGPESKAETTSDDALMTAYHEGGHAIVAYFTEAAGTLDRVTIVPRGESLGHTLCVPDDSKHVTKANCTAQIDVLLGGRAAEELIFGPNKITANANNDLELATSIASRMVKSFGMSETVGLRTLNNSETGIRTVNQFGVALADQMDLEVKRLIQESYERSKKILREHAKEHKLLAEALVKYKTLNGEDVKALLGDNSSKKGSKTRLS